MDFRERNLDQAALKQAGELIVEGLISYQPFVFAEDLEVGVGYEFEEQRYAGLLHYPAMPEHLRASPELARRLLPAGEKAAFRAANRRLAAFYDALTDEIVTRVGGGTDKTFLDVGCNNGYLPIRFAERGAALAAGCDRQDFARVFNFLNEITGTDARFFHAWYDPAVHRIEGLDTFDVVTSMAMLCHVSDPLHLLAELGRHARDAIFVWTLFSDDDGHVVRYGDPRGDYPSDAFPYCFDNLTALSVPLLTKSMMLMGFPRIIELTMTLRCPYTWRGYPFRGFLALREA